MVFERKHYNAGKDVPVGDIADILNSQNFYNNTNASGYINGIRIKKRLEEINLKNSNNGGIYIDPPPPEDY